MNSVCIAHGTNLLSCVTASTASHIQLCITLTTSCVAGSCMTTSGRGDMIMSVFLMVPLFWPFHAELSQMRV